MGLDTKFRSMAINCTLFKAVARNLYRHLEINLAYNSFRYARETSMLRLWMDFYSEMCLKMCRFTRIVTFVYNPWRVGDNSDNLSANDLGLYFPSLQRCYYSYDIYRDEVAFSRYVSFTTSSPGECQRIALLWGLDLDRASRLSLEANKAGRAGLFDTVVLRMQAYEVEQRQHFLPPNVPCRQLKVIIEDRDDLDNIRYISGRNEESRKESVLTKITDWMLQCRIPAVDFYFASVDSSTVWPEPLYSLVAPDLQQLEQAEPGWIFSTVREGIMNTAKDEAITHNCDFECKSIAVYLPDTPWDRWDTCDMLRWKQMR